jgi:hypothetical protein
MQPLACRRAVASVWFRRIRVLRAGERGRSAALIRQSQRVKQEEKNMERRAIIVAMLVSATALCGVRAAEPVQQRSDKNEFTDLLHQFIRRDRGLWWLYYTSLPQLLERADGYKAIVADGFTAKRHDDVVMNAEQFWAWQRSRAFSERLHSIEKQGTEYVMTTVTAANAGGSSSYTGLDKVILRTAIYHWLPTAKGWKLVSYVGMTGDKRQESQTKAPTDKL